MSLRIKSTALASLLALAPLGCKNTIAPGDDAHQRAVAMGDWSSWLDLRPLVDVAQNHAPAPTVTALREASVLLAERKAKSADDRLAAESSATGHKWVAIARGNLAALHFSVCIRGIALRIEDGKTPSATDRERDFSEDTRIKPGDVSIEATLTNLDAAVADPNKTLSTQARIARARVAAFAQQCAANEDVAALALRIVETDLATLAAEGHLTPDLAYIWAGVQMNRFSGSAARPFLLQALEGGFDHPAVSFMLAVIALEERQFDHADELATEVIERYVKLGDKTSEAEAHFVRGEVARAKEDLKTAKKHYQTAFARSDGHIPALLALAELQLADQGEAAAVSFLRGHLPRFLLTGVLTEQTARDAAENMQSVVMLATDPHTAQLVRDALLDEIDAEGDAMRRGLRYFYAATLDVRLREYEVAHGHGVFAKEEFASTEIPAPIDVEAFLERLTRAAAG